MTEREKRHRRRQVRWWTCALLMVATLVTAMVAADEWDWNTRLIFCLGALYAAIFSHRHEEP